MEICAIYKMVTYNVQKKKAFLNGKYIINIRKYLFSIIYCNWFIKNIFTYHVIWVRLGLRVNWSQIPERYPRYVELADPWSVPVSPHPRHSLHTDLRNRWISVLNAELWKTQDLFQTPDVWNKVETEFQGSCVYLTGFSRKSVSWCILASTMFLIWQVIMFLWVTNCGNSLESGGVPTVFLLHSASQSEL